LTRLGCITTLAPVVFCWKKDNFKTMDKELLENAEYLNVGCGTVRFNNCINMDIADNPLVKADIIGNVLHIPFPDKRFKGVIFAHVLEHILKREHQLAMIELRRVLTEGGTIYIEVPDFRRSLQFYLDNYRGNEEYWYQCIFGREDYSSDVHRSGITERYLTDLLFDCGFKNLKWLEIPKEQAILGVIAERSEEVMGERL
jgi:predicted SAM-dependent methyltransferase